MLDYYEEDKIKKSFRKARLDTQRLAAVLLTVLTPKQKNMLVNAGCSDCDGESIRHVLVSKVDP